MREINGRQSRIKIKIFLRLNKARLIFVILIQGQNKSIYCKTPQEPNSLVTSFTSFMETEVIILTKNQSIY